MSDNIPNAKKKRRAPGTPANPNRHGARSITTATAESIIRCALSEIILMNQVKTE